MPRTKVPPGRASKRSCSRASSWRAPNLSCCAMPASDSPCACRARASSSPTPVFSGAVLVILPALQRLILARLGVAPPQLVGEARFGDALAELSLGSHRQPKRLRRRRDQAVEATHQLAGLLEAALAVADLAELQQRRRLVGLDLQRALEELLRVLEIVDAHHAQPRRRIRAPRRGVERIADRLQKIADRAALASGLALEPAVVVVDLRVVGRQAQRALEARPGGPGLAPV